MRAATNPSTPVLALGALGVVFGDIGTSPLYAFQVAMATGVDRTTEDILGVVSLFVWAIIVIVGIKYLLLVMRVSNRGEGGVLALSALVRRTLGGRRRRWAFMAGLLGVGLFYADGAITPAISVLSAAEGVEVSYPAATSVILPIALVVITVLFLVQRFGTGRMGLLFGPVMAIWFVAIGALGLREVIRAPVVLQAFDPLLGIRFLATHAGLSLAILGAVVLCVTGAEALYADMGHFRRGPIALAFVCVALPGLVLSYLGQAALVLDDPAAASNPFFNLGPAALQVPLLVLATVATFIASQAVISGVFSMTRQAIRLDLLPRERVVHTSTTVEGQIFMPFPTWVLYLFVVALILAFGTSTALAGAYGAAVTATMVITTVLTLVMARRAWGWKPLLVTLAFGPLLIIDLMLLSSVIDKIPRGGWVSLVVALLLLGTMLTWQRGRAAVRRRMAAESPPMADLPQLIPAGAPVIPGVAVFMTADPAHVPHSLGVHLRHNRLGFRDLVIVSVGYRDTPRVDPSARVLEHRIADHIRLFEIAYGFVERPDIPGDLQEPWRAAGLAATPREATYVLGDDVLVVTDIRDGMPIWQKRVFVALHRNAARSADHFRLPPDRVMHLGTEIAI